MPFLSGALQLWVWLMSGKASLYHCATACHHWIFSYNVILMTVMVQTVLAHMFCTCHFTPLFVVVRYILSADFIKIFATRNPRSFKSRTRKPLQKSKWSSKIDWGYATGWDHCFDFFQCFNIVGLVSENNIWPIKTSAIWSKSSFSAKLEEEVQVLPENGCWSRDGSE